MPVGRPVTRFLHTDRGAVGYQVFGEGDRDIVFITHWLTNVDMYWDEPSAIRYLDRLASIGRVILIDKLGSGVSDEEEGEWPVAPVETHMDSINAVIDEVGIDSAILVGDTEGGMLSMLLAATYPNRFPVLVLINSYARLLRAEDYPIGAPPEVVDRMREAWVEQHGTTGEVLRFTAPSVFDDARFRSWFVRFQRGGQKQRAAMRAIPWIAATDVRPALEAIQSRTLVVHRRDAAYHRLIHGQYLAEHIEGAELVVLPGADTLPFHAGEVDDLLDVVESFLGSDAEVRPTNRQLATVLFTDIVGSTAMASELGDRRWLDLLEEHDRIVRLGVERFRGDLVKTTGDGAVATFDGPYRAVEAARLIRNDLDPLGISIRAGLHTGEIERRGDEVGGLAIHLAARVMDSAESGGIVVSSTVRDLVVGSRLEFAACGSFDLKGIPGSWDLYEVS